jgi:hypothetical protein
LVGTLPVPVEIGQGSPYARPGPRDISGRARAALVPGASGGLGTEIATPHVPMIHLSLVPAEQFRHQMDQDVAAFP